MANVATALATPGKQSDKKQQIMIIGYGINKQWRQGLMESGYSGKLNKLSVSYIPVLSVRGNISA